MSIWCPRAHGAALHRSGTLASCTPTFAKQSLIHRKKWSYWLNKIILKHKWHNLRQWPSQWASSVKAEMSLCHGRGSRIRAVSREWTFPEIFYLSTTLCSPPQGGTKENLSVRGNVHFVGFCPAGCKAGSSGRVLQKNRAIQSHNSRFSQKFNFISLVTKTKTIL